MSDDEGVEPATAFAALGDPIRVAVLEALAEDRRDDPEEPGLAFSELRKRVGVRDSGRFRYHLETLRGPFVEQADDGSYRLTYAGSEVVTAIVAGTYTERATLGPTDLDSDCELCGAGAVGSYEDGVLSVRCANDHPLFVWSLPPNAASDATLRELVRTATLDLYQTVETTRTGTCPDCYAGIDTRVEPTDGAGQPYRFRARCEACGSVLDVPAGCCLVGHPEVEALYRRHGRSIREGYWWELEFARADASVERVDDDPLALRVAIAVGDERLRATVDDAGAVREIEAEADGQ